MMEKALNIARKMGRDNKIVVVCDLRGVGWKNTDMKMGVKTMQIMYKYYVETIYRIYNFPLSYLQKLSWTIMKPFLSERTKKRIIVVDT